MSKTTKKQGMLSSEERKWNDPASILYRWKIDPTPVGRSDSEDKSMDTIIEIKKVIDVDSYMQEKFGSA